MIAGKESSFGSLQLRASLPRPQPFRLARSPRHLCIALYPHFERFLPGKFIVLAAIPLSLHLQSVLVLSSRIVLPPAQESAESPLQNPQNQICLSQWATIPFQICSAITKLDCGRRCERGRLGLGLQREECDNPTPIGGQDIRWKRSWILHALVQFTVPMRVACLWESYCWTYRLDLRLLHVGLD